MATDYDAPRRNETDDMAEDSLDELKARRNEAQSAVVDVDESETAESFELPGADLSGEELTVKVLPKQADEFTCASCFLVHHRSRLAQSERRGHPRASQPGADPSTPTTISLCFMTCLLGRWFDQVASRRRPES